MKIHSANCRRLQVGSHARKRGPIHALRRSLPIPATAVIALCVLAGPGQAQGRTVDDLPRSEQPRSILHPAATSRVVPPGPDSDRIWPAPGLSPVCEGEGWTLYSGRVNGIRAVGQIGDETWLGTAMGVKRIERSTGNVRHYTRLDGLPAESVLALAADGDDVWCLVSEQSTEIRKFYACRWDRRTERWETLREWWNAVSERDRESFDPPGMYAIAVSERYAAFYAGRTGEQATARVLLWDRKEASWRDLSWPGEIPNDPQYPPIRYLSVDEGGLWMGTKAGLLRCRLPEERWERSLQNLDIRAGAKDGDAFYLAGTEPDNGSMGEQVRLIRFEPATGNVRDFLTPEAVKNKGVSSSVRTVAIDGDAAIWLISKPRVLFSPTYFYRLDRATGVLKGITTGVNMLFRENDRRRDPQETDTQDAGKDIPDAVVAAAVATHLPLPNGLADRRFPAWFCPWENLPESVRGGVSPTSFDPMPVARWTDRDGAAWTSEDGALVRIAKNGTERFPLPDLLLPTSPRIEQVAAAGATLFARSGETIHRYDVPTDAWSRFDLPPLPTTPSHSWDALESDGTALWIRNGDSVSRYDPASRTLVATDGSSLPIDLRDEKGVSTPIFAGGGLFGPPLPPTGEIAAHVGKNASARPVARTGDLYWYHSRESTPDGAGYTAFAAYGGGWREPLRIRHYAGNVSLRESDGGVYLIPSGWDGDAPTGDDGSVYRYDRSGNRWSKVAPPPPVDARHRRSHRYKLISVDKDRLWLIVENDRGIWEYDRGVGDWREYPLPEKPNTFLSAASAARIGDSIFVAAAFGIQRFDTLRRAWTPLPIPAYARDLRLVEIQGNRDALWAIAVLDQGPQRVALRFDRKTHLFAWYGEEKGFPQHLQTSGLLLDAGASPWVIGGGAWQWDRETDRWVERTEALTRVEGAAPRTSAIAFDGESVWLLFDAPWRWPVPSVRPAAPRLGRWDEARREWEMYAVPNPECHLLRVEKGAVWLAGGRKIARLDSRARTWRIYEPPVGFPLPPTPSWRGLFTSDDELWLVGDGMVLRRQGKTK